MHQSLSCGQEGGRRSIHNLSGKLVQDFLGEMTGFTAKGLRLSHGHLQNGMTLVGVQLLEKGFNPFVARGWPLQFICLVLSLPTTNTSLNFPSLCGTVKHVGNILPLLFGSGFLELPQPVLPWCLRTGVPHARCLGSFSPACSSFSSPSCFASLIHDPKLPLCFLYFGGNFL